MARAKAGQLLAGAAWTYGAQVLSVGLQFGYAAITSRLVDADGYGTYAVALLVSGLVTLLATSGLGQTVARLKDVDPDIVSRLFRYGLGVGIFAAGFVLLSAPLWASMWGDSAATVPIRWMSVLAFVSPPLGVLMGLSRRLGAFKQLALCVFSTNVAGMCVGAFLVFEFRTPAALVASVAISQSLLLIVLSIRSRETIGRSVRKVSIREQLAFSWKVMSANILSYVTYTSTRWGVSRFLGPEALGSWNRGDVLTAVPFQQLQTAMIQTVYPEFRHDIDEPTRARRVWPDMLTIVSWVALPLSAAVAAIGPELVPVLFGSGWTQTSEMLPYLAVGAGIQLLSTVLASAVEALGRFWWVWSTQLILIGVQAAALIGIYFYRDLTIALVALVVTGCVRHTYQVALCVNAGYIDLSRLVKGYAASISYAVMTGVLLRTAICLSSDVGSSYGIVFVWVLILLFLVLLLFIVAKFSGLFSMASSYGLALRRPAKNPDSLS